MTPSLGLKHQRSVCALNGRDTFSISTEAPRSVQINPWTRPKKVTFSTTVECNYHVLNSLTHPHLHPPLFFPFSGGFFFFFLWAKITLGYACVSLQWKVSSTPFFFSNADVFRPGAKARRIRLGQSP